MSQILNGLKIKASSFGSCPDEQGNLFVEGKIMKMSNIVSYTGAITITAQALIANDIVKFSVGGPATNYAFTLPSATNLIAALPSGTEEGYEFNIIYANLNASGTNTASIAAGLGGTIIGQTHGSGTIVLPATINIKIVITGITSPAYEVYFI